MVDRRHELELAFESVGANNPWQYRWRLVLTHSWGAPKIEVLDFATTADLAAAIRRTQSDPRVARREHHRRRDWIGPVPEHRCGRRQVDWVPETYPCLCGDDHRWYRCPPCGIDEMVPAVEEWCGIIPWPRMDEDWRGRPPQWRPPKSWESQAGGAKPGGSGSTT